MLWQEFVILSEMIKKSLNLNFPKFSLLFSCFRSLSVWFMQTFVSIDIPPLHISLRLPGYARFCTSPKSHVWPFTKFIEFSRQCHRPWKIKITTIGAETRQFLYGRAAEFKARRIETKAIDSKQWRHASFGTTGDNWAIGTQGFETTNGIGFKCEL